MPLTENSAARSSVLAVVLPSTAARSKRVIAGTWAIAPRLGAFIALSDSAIVEKGERKLDEKNARVPFQI